MPRPTTKPKPIIYREVERHFRYQLGEDHVENLALKPVEPVTTAFIKYSKNGRIKIKKGYAWDGPIVELGDEQLFMRASLVHDALYQLMRLGLLDHRRDREIADRIFVEMCQTDGMPESRAQWVFSAVQDLGQRHARAMRSDDSRWYLDPEP